MEAHDSPLGPALAADALALRCRRPFRLEAQQLLVERIASPQEIDRICRLGGGFRLGPFELLDAVGIAAAHAADEQAFAESFGEPRWRPAAVSARMIAHGRLGRESGAGFYDGYPKHRPEDPPAPEIGGGDGVVVIAGDTLLSDVLMEAGEAAGWEMLDPVEAVGASAPFLIVDLVGAVDAVDVPLQGGPRVVCCTGGSLAALDQGGTAVGFHVLAPFADTQLVELTRSPDSAGSAAVAAERFFSTLGCHTAWVGDAPGLVLGRIVAQLVNEAAFALGEGAGSAEEIDGVVSAGLGSADGPLRWADQIGLEQILVTLDALSEERREERYRPAPELTRRVWSGRVGVQTGEGFYSYE